MPSLLERFELVDESGEPFDPRRLPGRAALAGERPPSATIGWRRRDGGGEHWSIVRSAPVFAADGSVLFAVNIFHDVTEHKTREGERESCSGGIEVERELLEAVLRQMPSGVIIAEAGTGRLILGNEQVERIWAHSFLAAAEIGEYSAYKGFHPDGRPLEPEEWPLARSLTTGEVVRDEEITILRGDGTRGTIEVDSSPVHDAEGRIVAGVVTFHDVTERKQRDEDMRFLAVRARCSCPRSTTRTRSTASRGSPCRTSPTGARSTCARRTARSGCSRSRTSTSRRSGGRRS